MVNVASVTRQRQPSTGGVSAANLAYRVDGLSLDLIHRHTSETLPYAPDCLAPQLDADGAFEQLAVALTGTALA